MGFREHGRECRGNVFMITITQVELASRSGRSIAVRIFSAGRPVSARLDAAATSSFRPSWDRMELAEHERDRKRQRYFIAIFIPHYIIRSYNVSTRSPPGISTLY